MEERIKVKESGIMINLLNFKQGRATFGKRTGGRVIRKRGGWNEKMRWVNILIKWR